MKLLRVVVVWVAESVAHFEEHTLYILLLLVQRITSLSAIVSVCGARSISLSAPPQPQSPPSIMILKNADVASVRMQQQQLAAGMQRKTQEKEGTFNHASKRPLLSPDKR